MKILSLSYCFPSAVAPTWGVFVMQRLAEVAKLADLEVAAPVPVFPLYSRLRGAVPPLRETIANLIVHHPRYFYFPGVLKTLDGWFYGHGLRGWLAAYCGDRRPDLLDAHFEWPDAVGVHYMAKTLDIPYTVTMRGWLHECLKSQSMTRQVAQALQGASAVISVDQAMADLAVERFGVSREKLHVIMNGVDTSRFRPADKAAMRRQLGLPVEGKLVVIIGHLKTAKGQAEAVQALAKLPPEVNLVVVGGEVEAGYRARLDSLVGSLGLADRVTLAGRRPYDVMPLYLAAADASVLASYREGCPNVVLESLSAGTPVVATRVGAVPDLVTPGENGEIVPPRDADAIAEALRRVLARPWDAQRVRASRCVQSWQDVARQAHAVFEKAIKR